jgi:hypothetical protein
MLNTDQHNDHDGGGGGGGGGVVLVCWANTIGCMQINWRV